MIVWGGSYFLTGNDHYLNDGARYNPAADTWRAVNTNGAPVARRFHTTVWTGTEMIVWGGFGTGYLGDGGRYNPANDFWSVVGVTGAPSARQHHTAVWTGNEMIIFGGVSVGASLSDTFSYVPSRTAYLYQRR
jgi:N-acetylneuraminic acid mutarotase